MHLGQPRVLHMPDMGIEREVDDRGLRALLAIVLVATSIGGAVDLYFDAPDTWWSAHVLYEIVLMTAAMLTSVMLWRGWWRSRRSLLEANRVLATHAMEREAWRANAESVLADFGKAVDGRFAAWGLTPTERDVALRLLKGHSHKQIAFETGRSERTVRQHAVSIYQKSGLAGRAELSAFFLEDLLLPSDRDGAHVADIDRPSLAAVSRPNN